MVYYMQFTRCMFNQSAISNHAVVNMHCPSYNIMLWSNLVAGGPPGGDGLQGGQVPLQVPGHVDDGQGHRDRGNARNDTPPRPGSGVGKDNRWRRWGGTGRMPGSTTEEEAEIKP